MDISTPLTTAQQPQMPQLIKKSITYKLIVPQKVEEKIRYLISKFPSTEWSGVLFYSHQGTFEDNNLVITCEDIYPMDLGTSGWTEFHMSEDVAAYMAQNIELFDYETGLIHSHHSMGAFFSGQDQRMLQQEGNDTNCFVSLVVDTRGTYVAAITRKIQFKSELTVRNLGTFYEFFGEGTKVIDREDSTNTKIIDKEVIEYYLLDVERHEVSNSLSYLDDRFTEITSKKKSFNSGAVDRYFSSINAEPTFFSDAEMGNTSSPTLTKDDNEKVNSLMQTKWTPNPKLVKRAIAAMLSCSLIINPDKFDIKQWIRKNINSVYEKTFGAEGFYSSANNRSFEEWKDFIIDYTFDHFNDPDMPDISMEEYICILANALLDEIFEYSSENQYIQAYCETLEQYAEY